MPRRFFSNTREEREEVLEVRKALLSRVLFIMWLAGLPAVVLGAIHAYVQGRWIFSIIYIVLYSIFIVLTIPSKTFSTQFKSLVLVSSLYLLTVSILIRLGMSGVALTLLIGLCFLVSLLFGFRRAVLAIVLSFGTIAFVAAGMITGFIPIYAEHMMTSVKPASWAIALCVFVMIASLAVLAPELLKRRIEESLDLAEKRKGDLETANQRLRQEIQGHEQAEEALKASEQRYRTLFDSADDAIFLLKDRKIVKCNEATLRLFGGSREDLLGQAVEDLSPPRQPNGEDTRKRAMEIYHAVYHGKKPKRFEWIHRRLDSTPFFAEVSLNRLDFSGEVHLQAIVRDITANKEAERALRESEYRFRTFYNSNPEGVVLLDFEGRILDANRALMTMSGYTALEIVDRHFTEFVPEAYHEAAWQAVLSMEKGISQKEPSEIALIREDGFPLPVSIKGWRITDEESRPVALGVFVRDLTKEKHLVEEKTALEKQLLQSQRIEAIGTLAGGIAHDFNNILGGIIGYTELALIEESPDEEGKRRDYLHRVLDAGRRAKDLVQQILRFSRPKEASVTTIAVTPLLKESVKLMRSILPKTIRIEQGFDADVDTICGDATQIHQVVMNLCTNAYHAMRDDGGVLALSLRNVSFPAPREWMSLKVPPGEYLQLGISDTGCGIEPQLSERIFNPYFTTKPGSEGSGLGLSVTLGIVKGHNGLIEMESTVGKGTRFDVYLPVARCKAMQEEPSADSLPVGRQENILVVDDELFFLDVVRESLEYLGYRVQAHASSLKALEAFKEDPTGFDLLVTDQTMPEMTGVQLIAEIRKLHGTVPVLLCTGYSETVTEQTAGYYGITRFLMKPVSTKDLARAVHEALDGKRIERST